MKGFGRSEIFLVSPNRQDLLDENPLISELLDSINAASDKAQST